MPKMPTPVPGLAGRTLSPQAIDLVKPYMAVCESVVEALMPSENGFTNSLFVAYKAEVDKSTKVYEEMFEKLLKNAVRLEKELARIHFDLFKSLPPNLVVSQFDTEAATRVAVRGYVTDLFEARLKAAPQEVVDRLTDKDTLFTLARDIVANEVRSRHNRAFMVSFVHDIGMFALLHPGPLTERDALIEEIKGDMLADIRSGLAAKTF